MFIFLIALKSPNASHDWQRTIKLLNQTLASIKNQTNLNYKVVVICNEKPFIDLNSIDFVLADLPQVYLDGAFIDKERDRASKLLIGFEYAKKYKPKYLMPVDADDFVNRNIVEYVLGSTTRYNGYYLESGYIYEHCDDLIYIDRGFKDYCGSSLIIKPHAFLDYFGGGVYLHNQINNLTKLPFDGVIYNRCNGENFAAKEPLKESMGRADPKFTYKPITAEIVNTFKLDRGR